MNHSNKEKRLEILAALITGLLKFVLMDWLNFRAFYIVAACLFWVIFIYKRYKTYPGILQEWGFRGKNLKISFLWLLPFAVITIAGVVIYGVFYNATFLNWHFIPILVFYPLWGVFQQFMIAALVGGNLKKLPESKLTNAQAIFLTSLLFALIHLPSLALLIYVFVMEMLFLIVYFKWNNLWALGLYHGVVSSFYLFFVMGRDLFNELWAVF